jgi:hypothetical protein
MTGQRLSRPKKQAQWARSSQVLATRALSPEKHGVHDCVRKKSRAQTDRHGRESHETALCLGRETLQGAPDMSRTSDHFFCSRSEATVKSVHTLVDDSCRKLTFGQDVGDMSECPICCESACAECIVCPACGAGCCRSCFERSLELNNDCCCFCKKRGMRALQRRLSKLGAGTSARMSDPSAASASDQPAEIVHHQFAAPGEVGQEFSALKAGADREARLLELEREVASLESTLAQGGASASLLSGFEVAQAGARAAAIRDLLARAAAESAVDVSEGALLGVAARLLLENQPPSAPSSSSPPSLGAAVGVQPRQAAAATLLQSWCKPAGPGRPAAAGAARRRSACGEQGAAVATAALLRVSCSAAVGGRGGGPASPRLLVRENDAGAALSADLGCDEVIVVDVDGELEGGEGPQEGRASSCNRIGHSRGGKAAWSRRGAIAARLARSLQLGISSWVQQQAALRSASGASRCSGRSRDNRVSGAISSSSSSSSGSAGSTRHRGQELCPDDGVVEVLGEEEGGGEDGFEGGACGGTVEVLGEEGGEDGVGGGPLAAPIPWTVGAPTREGPTASPIAPAAGGTASPLRQCAPSVVSNDAADATSRGSESCLPGPAPTCAPSFSSAASDSSPVNASSESTACFGKRCAELGRLQPERDRPWECVGRSGELEACLNASSAGVAGCGGQPTVSGVKRSHWVAFPVPPPLP